MLDRPKIIMSLTKLVTVNNYYTKYSLINLNKKLNFSLTRTYIVEI